MGRYTVSFSESRPGRDDALIPRSAFSAWNNPQAWADFGGFRLAQTLMLLLAFPRPAQDHRAIADGAKATMMKRWPRLEPTLPLRLSAMPLIRLFLEICLLRKGPQDAPASQMLLGLAFAAYCLVGVAQAVLDEQWLEGILQIPLQATILLVFVWGSLKAAGKTNRMQQTLIALLGTDALISSFAIPLEGLFLADPQSALIHLLLLSLMLWHMAVVAHILRHALSQTLVVGLALSFVYTVFTLQVLIMLFGPPATG